MSRPVLRRWGGQILRGSPPQRKASRQRWILQRTSASLGVIHSACAPSGAESYSAHRRRRAPALSFSCRDTTQLQQSQRSNRRNLWPGWLAGWLAGSDLAPTRLYQQCSSQHPRCSRHTRAGAKEKQPSVRYTRQQHRLLRPQAHSPTRGARLHKLHSAGGRTGGLDKPLLPVHYVLLLLVAARCQLVGASAGWSCYGGQHTTTLSRAAPLANHSAAFSGCASSISGGSSRPSIVAPSSSSSISSQLLHTM